MNGSVTKYVYSAAGEKLRVTHYTAVPNISVAIGSTRELAFYEIQHRDSTDYLCSGSLTLKNGRMDKCLFDGGYARAMETSATTDRFVFYFYNQDHLGNNRELVTSTGIIHQITNYYPFGAPYADPAAVSGADKQPYKYNGKELDTMHGLNTYDYGARQFNPILARWDRMDPLCEKYYSISPYAYCGNNPINAIDPDGKQPVKYIDSDGNKHISWSIVVMAQAPPKGASPQKIERYEKYKQILIKQYTEQFNHYLNGDGEGAINTSGERVVSDFIIKVIDVDNPYDSKKARNLSKEYGQEIKEEGGKNGDAAVFMKGSARGSYGFTNAASLITIASNAPEGTESHELFHTSGIGDNGYTSGGILNSPPEPISPREIDELWDILPERK